MRMLVMVVLFLSMVAGGLMEKQLSFTRDDFPASFVFGSGTSAYQVEGAAAEDGRKPSIWDTYAHGHGLGNGDITADGYHKYKEDVKLMAKTGLEAYRFSISWSRLIPDGRGSINPKGLAYYNSFINELVSHGIQPHVTLVHFDLPQILEDEYEGWLSPKIIDDFTAYANVCFSEFGDRVSHWITINEVNAYALGGYDIGTSPPGRCSYPFGNCTHGDSTTEPYIMVHHCLLAHSSVALLYRTKYQAHQRGLIGLNLLGLHFQPLTNSTSDLNAAKRGQDFYVGWLVEPLVFGHYPKTMEKITGSKMPQFSSNQSKQLMASYDFIGVNYYVSIQVAGGSNSTPSNQRDFMGDSMLSFTGSAYGPTSIDPVTASYGLQEMLEHFKQAYGNPPIYIHENGCPMPQKGTLEDTTRVEHMSAHLGSLLDAIRNGSNTRGFFTWSFMDLFEIFGGYQITYGLYYVDFGSSDRKRYAKLSSGWYSNFLKRKARVFRMEKLSFNASDDSVFVM